MTDAGPDVLIAAEATARAQLVMERSDLLGGFSEEPERLTRRYGTAALRRAQDATAVWMEAAGMTVRRDPLGNQIARYEAGRPGAKTLLLGSHLDSVRDAGKYDGPLGVLVAIAAVERLHRLGRLLPFAIEVVAFADEEGLRFSTFLLGSRAFVGGLDPAWLGLVDNDGVTLADAIRAFGGEPDALQTSPRVGHDWLGYAEVHIEQGPALEALGLPVGVVSAIAGQDRIAVAFTGEAGHAGTVAMDRRRDALCAAAEFVLAAERTARERPGLVTTVGQIAAEPGASNVIPGLTRLSLDLRHADDAVRRAATGLLREQATGIAERRDLALDWRPLADHDAVPFPPDLAVPLAQAIEQTGHPVHRLPSGAGHDAITFAPLTPVAMLFVRCVGGVSHHPAEAVAVEDVAVAIDVMDRFVAVAADGLR